MAMFHGIPGKMTLVVTEVPTQFASTVKVHSIAKLRERFGNNDEGYLTDPMGEKHYFSLKPWSKADPYTIFLQIAYRFTPSTDIAPGNPLYPQNAHSLYPDSNFTAFAIRNKNHEIAIRSLGTVPASASTTPPAMNINYLLTFPEVKQMRLLCPICDTILELSQPLEKQIRILTAQMDADTTTIEVSISHPSHVQETKQRPAKYPFTVMRHEEQ